MRTSLALVLALLAPAFAQAKSLSWQTDYASAQRQAANQGKPLAVVFGEGPNGWKQLSGGTLSEAAADTLAKQYVCCYVDTTTPAGQTLARGFEMTGPVGLVISDHSGQLQAYWHDGTLPADLLANRLRQYSDPQRAVNRTDVGTPVSPVSYYPPQAPAVAPAAFAPAAQAVPPAFAPAPFAAPAFSPAMGFSGFGGGCRS